MQTVVLLAFIVVVVFVIMRTAQVVPQRMAFIVERLGRYTRTLEAGFHILIPFVDRVAYKHSLKEMAIDVPPQLCIRRSSPSPRAIVKPKSTAPKDSSRRPSCNPRARCRSASMRPRAAPRRFCGWPKPPLKALERMKPQGDPPA